MEIVLLSPSRSKRSFSINTSNRPSWLLSTLSELEERMKILATNPNNNNYKEDQQIEDKGDTFAERAESYYRKRPQLLALLHDLYNSYVTLSDRYMQANSKNTPAIKRYSSQASMCENDTESDSEVQSSISYQQPQEQSFPQRTQWQTQNIGGEDYDAIIAELILKSVEVEAATEEAASWERRFGESSQKADLQRSLLEVLESERVVLLNENARLEYRVAALAEENEGLAAESRFVRRHAAELARRALARAREDQRVCLLSRRIEDLQGQIDSLEKRNKEHFDEHQSSCSGCSSSSLSFSSSSASLCLKNNNYNIINIEAQKDKEKKNNEVVLEGCFRVTRRSRLSPKIKRNDGVDDDDDDKKQSKLVVGFWDRVKRMDFLVCGVNKSSSSSSG